MIKNLKITVKPVKNFTDIGKTLSAGGVIDPDTLANMQVLKFEIKGEADTQTIEKIVKSVQAMQNAK